MKDKYWECQWLISELHKDFEELQGAYQRLLLES